MKKSIIKNNWKDIKEKIKQQWEKLTDPEVSKNKTLHRKKTVRK